MLWLALIVTVYGVTTMAADVVVVDLLNVNPNRTLLHAISLPVIFSPIVFVTSLIVLLVAFSASLLIQGILMVILVRKLNWSAFYYVMLTVPLLAVLSWHCYDYLLPSDLNLGINEGEDWVSYQHGMSGNRYLKSTLAQFGVSALVIIQLVLRLKRMTIISKYLNSILCGSAFIAGAVSGILMAQIAN
jgi:hypothetical protein